MSSNHIDPEKFPLWYATVRAEERKANLQLLIPAGVIALGLLVALLGN